MKAPHWFVALLITLAVVAGCAGQQTTELQRTLAVQSAVDTYVLWPSDSDTRPVRAARLAFVVEKVRFEVGALEGGLDRAELDRIAARVIEEIKWEGKDLLYAVLRKLILIWEAEIAGLTNVLDEQKLAELYALLDTAREEAALYQRATP